MRDVLAFCGNGLHPDQYKRNGHLQNSFHFSDKRSCSRHSDIHYKALSVQKIHRMSHDAAQRLISHMTFPRTLIGDEDRTENLGKIVRFPHLPQLQAEAMHAHLEILPFCRLPL
ncbi:hypothetical protein D3C76_1553980 [compost metagenome]